MVFVKHDHMAEQVPAAVADEALRDSVLPWALKGRSLRPVVTRSSSAASPILDVETVLCVELKNPMIEEQRGSL
jgi:hypothetical protein